MLPEVEHRISAEVLAGKKSSILAPTRFLILSLMALAFVKVTVFILSHFNVSILDACKSLPKFAGPGLRVVNEVYEFLTASSSSLTTIITFLNITRL